MLHGIFRGRRCSAAGGGWRLPSQRSHEAHAGSPPAAGTGCAPRPPRCPEASDGPLEGWVVVGWLLLLLLRRGWADVRAASGGQVDAHGGRSCRADGRRWRVGAAGGGTNAGARRALRAQRSLVRDAATPTDGALLAFRPRRPWPRPEPSGGRELLREPAPSPRQRRPRAGSDSGHVCWGPTLSTSSS